MRETLIKTLEETMWRLNEMDKRGIGLSQREKIAELKSLVKRLVSGLVNAIERDEAI